MSFRTLGLGSSLLKTIEQVGYSMPTPVQAAAIPRILEGGDLVGIAQTGTGKTAAFVLPLLERLSQMRPSAGRRSPRVLILAPTRELAAQTDQVVRDFARSLSFRSVTIFGGVGERPQIEALRRGVDIIIATPGRLLDLMTRRHVDLRQVHHLVLDEADRMLDMGFLPQIRRIIEAAPRERQTLLFSATLSREIERTMAEFLRQPRLVEIGRRANPVDSVEQVLYPVAKPAKIDLLLKLLRDPSFQSVLVFSRTKHGADKISRKLKAAGVRTATLHSNRSQSQRTAALSAFRVGNCRVLVGTDIAARGIDVEGISHVVNFDFPMHAEDYVHRIGRTGRASATGDAISFVSVEDEAAVRDVERLIGRSIPRRTAKGFETREPVRAPAVSRPSAHHHARPSQARPKRPAARRSNRWYA